MCSISQKIVDVLCSMSRNNWKNIFSLIMLFLTLITLSNKVEKYLCLWFICVSVCLVCARFNSLKSSSNVVKFMFFISYIEWVILKAVYMGLRVRLWVVYGIYERKNFNSYCKFLHSLLH